MWETLLGIGRAASQTAHRKSQTAQTLFQES
jgi:hypothetical protein